MAEFVYNEPAPVEEAVPKERILAVLNLPIVGKDRVDKLKRVIQKVVGKVAPLVEDEEEAIYMPFGDDGMTKGTGFLFFKDAEGAEKAFVQLQGFALGKENLLRLFKMGDFDKIAIIPDKRPEFVEPQYTAVPDYGQWLADPETIRGAEQFMVVGGDIYELHRTVPTAPSSTDSLFRRSKLSDSYIKWSPNGSFVAGIFQQGCLIRGGKPLDNDFFMRISFRDVKFVDFSPKENYVFLRRVPTEAGDLVCSAPFSRRLPDGRWLAHMMTDTYCLSNREIRSLDEEKNSTFKHIHLV